MLEDRIAIVEKNIPIPDKNQGHRIYNVNKMSIGDSFFIRCKKKDFNRMQSNILSSLRPDRGNGKYTTKRSRNGIWVTKIQ